MSDKNDWYLESTPKPSLAFWIFNQMTIGAVYAALVLFGLIAVILVLIAISRLLPENPYAVLETGLTALRALA